MTDTATFREEKQVGKQRQTGPTHEDILGNNLINFLSKSLNMRRLLELSCSIFKVNVKGQAAGY